MTSLQFKLARLKAMLFRPRLDHDLAEEIETHIALRRQSLIDAGMDPREAAYEARRMFGNVTKIREETRDMRSLGWLDTLLQDTRFGARLLRRSPAFTLAAVASLSIGIGAAAAVFSLADGMLFQKLAVRAPGELVLFRWVSGPQAPLESLNGYGTQSETESSSTSFSLGAYEAVRSQLAAEVEMFAFADLYRSSLTIDGQPDTVYAQSVSGNYFDTLGIAPAAGRLLNTADDRPGAPAAAVIGFDFWQRRFGGSPAAVGKLITLNGVSFTVAGVLPRGFAGTMQVGQLCDVMVPISTYTAVTRSEDDIANANFWWVLMMGRLKPGVTPERVQMASDLVVKNTVRAARPKTAEADLPRVVVEDGSRGQTENRNGMVEPLRMMAAAVTVMLLVACANVANLLLARGRARSREIAVRTAIGASRSRLVRQLLTEGMLLGVTASVLGLILGRWLSAALMPALTGPFTVNVAYSLDLRILAFTCALAVGCSLLFALLPALRATDAALTPALQEGSRGTVGAANRFAAGGALVVAQVALSMLLLSAAGLLAWSAYRLQNVNPGFDPTGVVTFSIDTSLNGYDATRTRAYIARALDDLRAVPGVKGASITSHRLIANSSSVGISRAEGVAPVDPDGPDAQEFIKTHRTWRQTVDDRFFETMKIPLLRGGPWSASIGPESPAVAIVNVSLARQLFGTEDVVGRRFHGGMGPKATVYQVVGVAADSHYTSLKAAPPATAYFAYQQALLNRVTFNVRTEGNATALVATLRETLRRLDDTVPIFDVRTLDEQILRSLVQERLFAWLALMLGGITLLLSAIGLYGLLAYAVTRRTPEIGIRIALGAERRQVRWMVLRQSLVLVGCGLALGVPGAWASASIVESLLFGLTPTDPRVIAGAATTMVTVALAAAYIPARRASRINPITALRD
ncbi:MAG TPA: ABC transporter permease [Vicinamibacterales bacterium]|nr:ABC transporter permease [Vicinamibacterales bacterium]